MHGRPTPSNPTAPPPLPSHTAACHIGLRWMPTSEAVASLGGQPHSMHHQLLTCHATSLTAPSCPALHPLLHTHLHCAALPHVTSPQRCIGSTSFFVVCGDYTRHLDRTTRACGSHTHCVRNRMLPQASCHRFGPLLAQRVGFSNAKATNHVLCCHPTSECLVIS